MIHLKSIKTFVYVFVVCICAPLPLAAQWTPGGVNLGGYELDGRDAVSDGAGGVVVVWDDRRGGPHPNRFDVYAQRWDNTGVELWDAGGTPVCSLASNASTAVAASDGAGGAIFVWSDGRTTGAGAGIYAQLVNAAGTHMWTYQGVPVSTAGTFIGNIDAVADGFGGVVVVWVDWRSGSPQVYAQRLDFAGTAQWVGDKEVPDFPADHYTPRILETLDGGAIIAWVSGPSINRDVYVQRLDLSGTRLWNTGVALPICVVAQSQSNLALTGDGAGGAVIAWEDRRIGDDIYAQRVNSSGIVQWTADGVVVCDDGFSQSGPRACQDGTGGAIIAWSDQRDQGEGGGASPYDGSLQEGVRSDGGSLAAATRITEPDIYMQRMNGSGAAQWTANGIVVTAGTFGQSLGGIVPDGAGGAVVSWEDDSDDDRNDDVILQRFDASGNEVWATGGVVHATGVGSRQVFAMVTDGGSNTIPVWTTFINTAAASSLSGVASSEVASSGNAVTLAAAAQSNTIYVQRIDNVDGDCTCGPSTSAGPVRVAQPLILTAAVPNPSSGTAELRMFLERSSDVTVDVFDVRGRRVASEHVGRATEGWRTLRFDGRALPNGVYFYRVTAGAETNTRKIVIQK